MCQSTMPTLLSYIHWAIVSLPLMLLTAMSTYKILVLRRRVAVAPVTLKIGTMSPPSLPVILRIFRLVVFTSGLFWVIIFPACLGITVVLRSRISFTLMELGVNIPEARLIRACYFIVSSTTYFEHSTPFIHTPRA